MGNLKSVIPILVSIVIAVAGTWFIYQWVQTQRAPKEAVKVQTDAMPVVVAATNIPWGTKLKPEMTKIVPFLRESLPEGSFSKISDINDRVLISPLKANDPVTESRLAPTSVQTGGITAILPPGKRAISVHGDKVIGIAGLVHPGDIVDVLVTVGSGDEGISETKLVLEKIPVMATGTLMQKNEKGEPAPVDVYTLQVTPEESEKLALAATDGRIQLSLRAITDTESVYTNGMTIPKLLTSLSSKKFRPEPLMTEAVQHRPVVERRWVPKPTRTVEIIKGTAVSQQNFTR